MQLIESKCLVHDNFVCLSLALPQLLCQQNATAAEVQIYCLRRGLKGVGLKRRYCHMKEELFFMLFAAEHIQIPDTRHWPAWRCDCAATATSWRSARCCVVLRSLNLIWYSLALEVRRYISSWHPERACSCHNANIASLRMQGQRSDPTSWHLR